MVDVTSTYNNDIVTEVVGGMEVSNVVSGYAVELVSVTMDWLTHHVFSVDIKVDVIDQSFEVSVVAIFVILMDFFLNEFKFASAELAVADDVTEDFDSLVHVILEDLETE